MNLALIVFELILGSQEFFPLGTRKTQITLFLRCFYLLARDFHGISGKSGNDCLSTVFPCKNHTVFTLFLSLGTGFSRDFWKERKRLFIDCISL